MQVAHQIYGSTELITGRDGVNETRRRGEVAERWGYLGACRSPDWLWGSAVDKALVERD
jgi:hypothetical protein